MVKKKVLVYPCGTEIGLEIYRAVHHAKQYELYGGSSTYDHGRFVYERHVDNLPFITDSSGEEDIRQFNQMIAAEHFDFIYPAMDGVITVFAKYRHCLDAVVLAPEYATAAVTRSKQKTYELLDGVVPLPRIYALPAEVKHFPVFMKPAVGQGAKGTKLITDATSLKQCGWESGKHLLLEYLPGDEFTIDCFTNAAGKLVYARGRGRRRIRDGISVNTLFVENDKFQLYAERINQKLQQKGAWFFQVREAEDGTLKLLEVASRIAGTSAVDRCTGVNLPLLTLDTFARLDIDDVVVNGYAIELDRALENRYHVDLAYDTVYIDYDDTVVSGGAVNLLVMRFLWQCVNRGKRLVLLTKHEGDLQANLREHRLEQMFDEVIHLQQSDDKAEYIQQGNAIFVDDSYAERRQVYQSCHIPVFDVPMLECLLIE